MKHDRSDKYTTGLCDIIDGDRDKRLCFFEIDGFNALQLYEVIGQYHKFKLDLLVHRTGKGFHFLSPTLVNLKTWKEFHEPLRHINSECPMTCLRVEPNKWEMEPVMWFDASEFYFCDNPHQQNISSVCLTLFRFFQILFTGSQSGEIKLVRYPLPTQIQCSNCNEKYDKIQEVNHQCETK